MNVNVINEFRVEIELKNSELENYGVTFASLDYGDIETRRFLNELVGCAKLSGVKADMSGRVLIEAFKTDDGCRVCFSFLPPRNCDFPSVKQLVKKDETCIMLRCEEKTVLSRLSRFINDSTESSLWKDSNGYILFVFANVKILQRIADAAAEFNVRAFLFPGLIYAHCEETAVCLIKTDAVKELS